MTVLEHAVVSRNSCGFNLSESTQILSICPKMCCKAQMHGHEKKRALMAQELILYTLLLLCTYIYLTLKHTHTHTISMCT